MGFRPLAGEEEQESWGDLAMHPTPSLGGFRRSGLQCPRTAGRSHQSQVHIRAWEAEGAGAPTPAPAIHPGWHLLWRGPGAVQSAENRRHAAGTVP